jgi:signal transduction histidine kinase
VAGIVGYRLRTVWRESVAALDDQLALSLQVTRGEVEAWVQHHAAFVSVAAGFLDARAAPDREMARLARVLDGQGAYDGAWLIGDGGLPVAIWPGRELAEAPPEVGGRNGAGDGTVARCITGFCAYFAEPVAGAPSPLRLVIRAPIGDETFPRLNPSRSTVRTGRTLIVARMGDSVAIIARRGGGSGDGAVTSRRVLAASELPPQVGESFRGRAPHGVGIGIDGSDVIYAMTPVPGSGWAMARELEVSELRDNYRHGMLISESIIAALLLSVAVLVEHLVRARASRRQQQLAAIRTEFVSSVSHELRTPLAQIRMFAELLRSGTLRRPEEAERALGIIEKEAKRLTILVENVLNFTSIRKRAGHPEIVPCNVGEEIELVADAFAPLAAERDSEVIWSAPSIYLRVDSLALRQILINFLENAVKYGPRGQTVSIIVEHDGAWVKVHVDDEGAGVPADARESIWRAFYRLDQAVRTGKTGSGIGLSVARDLALQYGGRVSVSDAPSGGARFTVEFPRSPSPRSPSPRSPEAES